ncbi:MAG TPA: hypothetical protein VHS31_09045 [Tepidisphaeraceae bacterium]|jgi:hypothetical protein|nr:hypothetical protein [Tepidisphaeraceae bacterium]
MRWRVEGADSTTGLDTYHDVYADNAKEAERIAHDLHKMLVSSIKPIEDGPVAIPGPSAQTVAYASRRAQLSTAPNYLGLRLASSVLAIFAALYYIGAAIILVFGAITAIGSGPTSARYGTASGLIPGSAALMMSILYAIFTAMIGAFLHGASSICMAIRDIARNSFAR